MTSVPGNGGSRLSDVRTVLGAGRVIVSVELSPRQQRQLLDVSDALGLPMHEIAEQAIVAYLESYGHHPRGRMKQPARSRKGTRA